MKKSKKHQTVLSAGQMKELNCAVIEGIPTNTPADDAQYWIGNKKKLAREIRKIIVRKNPYSDIISEYEKFYHDLGINCDLSSVTIPDDPCDFARILTMNQGITPQKAYDLCASAFPCWKNVDLDMVTSERNTKNGPYAIRVRDRVEADMELKNLSYRDLKEKNIPGITLEERLIYELKYFTETGKHLDIDNITICSGSLDSVGSVSCVDWSDGKLKVYWGHPDYRYDSLRSRRAVS